jgi:single-stranded-DNA-specific exonuclease
MVQRTMTEFSWKAPQHNYSDECGKLAQSLGIPNLIAQLLINRGITDYDEAKSFFRPGLDKLHDPFLMEDMDKAVTRLDTAILNHQRILIYGDYDVDGSTAVSLMVAFLRNYTDNLIHYQPDRYSEGYGISSQGIAYAGEQEVALIIALDCGITAVDKIEEANRLGIDVIICDHHTPGDVLPAAKAILNPKKKSCSYPYKELCGCGIGFKLLQAWSVKNGKNENELWALLDLVAIAIGADIVPITGENRILAYHGLQMINQAPRLGIKLLLELNSRKKKDFTITDLVFIIAPRINAAGRIDHAKYAVNLLLTQDYAEAEQINMAINAYNTERRELDTMITADALQELIENPFYEKSFSTVVWSQNWHKGVVGIVASRLIERYYKPTIVLALNETEATGSARSVDGFDVYEAISKCSDLLTKFGGHKYAAGLSLPIENLEKFRQKFEDVVQAIIQPDQLTPTLSVDAEIELNDLAPDGSSVFPKLFRITEQFAPFGPGNMKPIFLIRNLVDTGYAKAVGGDHLKVQLTNTNSRLKLDGIAFKMADKIDLVLNKQPIDILCTLEANEFNGNVNLQLSIKDIKKSNSWSFLKN